ncbi:hypothetical protein EAO28_02730 [Klebsiella pneumoniae]|uniref:Uncharacterized protein n=1 Tax=Klebsiella pneumoniae TaxID=573 RepID=A0A3P2EHK2_KLEPN|nr:hypothetical protein EAO28_02730 [Klebsiella pneumoniae]
MFNALTANNYAGEPRFGVFPDDDRLQYTQLRNVQYHPFLDRQVYTLIVKWVGLIGDQCRFSGSKLSTFVLPLAPYTSIEFLAMNSLLNI